MLTGYYKKNQNKERLEKKARERYQDLSEEEKLKSIDTFVNDTEIFLKEGKAKTKSANMIGNIIKIFLKNKNKG